MGWLWIFIILGLLVGCTPEGDEHVWTPAEIEELERQEAQRGGREKLSTLILTICIEKPGAACPEPEK